MLFSASKHNIFIFIFCILALNSWAEELNDTEKECEAEEEEVEKCAFKFLLFRNESFLQSSSEISDYCSDQRGNEKCLSDHSKKCLSHSAKQAIGELIRVMYKQNENICSNKSQRRLHQRVQTCLSTNQAPVNECYQKFITDIHGLHQFGQDEKMPLICCTYTHFQGCITNITKQQCQNDISNTISRLIQVYAGETLNYVCRDYKTSSRCSKYQKPDVDYAKIQEEIPKTFFSLLVKIYLS